VAISWKARLSALFSNLWKLISHIQKRRVNRRRSYHVLILEFALSGLKVGGDEIDSRIGNICISVVAAVKQHHKIVKFGKKRKDTVWSTASTDGRFCVPPHTPSSLIFYKIRVIVLNYYIWIVGHGLTFLKWNDESKKQHFLILTISLSIILYKVCIKWNRLLRSTCIHIAPAHLRNASVQH